MKNGLAMPKGASTAEIHRDTLELARRLIARRSITPADDGVWR
jgi:hypothetical protein